MVYEARFRIEPDLPNLADEIRALALAIEVSLEDMISSDSENPVPEIEKED